MIMYKYIWCNIYVVCMIYVWCYMYVPVHTYTHISVQVSHTRRNMMFGGGLNCTGRHIVFLSSWTWMYEWWIEVYTSYMLCTCHVHVCIGSTSYTARFVHIIDTNIYIATQPTEKPWKTTPSPCITVDWTPRWESMVYIQQSAQVGMDRNDQIHCL